MKTALANQPKSSDNAWHKSLQALNLCIQIPLVRDSPKTRKKRRTPKGMRRYIKTTKIYTKLYLSKKNEYSQVKSLINTQYVYGLQKRYCRQFTYEFELLHKSRQKAVYIINSAGIAYHQNEVLYIIIAKRNAACG